MAYLEDLDEIKKLYKDSKAESDIWRKDHPEYERLADNETLQDFLEDESLPDLNDGSLASSLFKLPKRIINAQLEGRATAEDSDQAWLTELANIRWKKMIKRSRLHARFHRKWKDAVRKSAIYGSVPLITIMTEKGADFIVAPPMDVKLEPGKVSDLDSKIIFWDVYYQKTDLLALIEQAEQEMELGSESPNIWDIEKLKEILESDAPSERDSRDLNKTLDDKAVTRGGFHFYIAFQRGVGAPFYMCYSKTGEVIRSWTNPDPSGDVPIHFLYCYQDFVNPYGIGIVKLAGGTQNFLDYLRKVDALATMLGIRPPKMWSGDIDSADIESAVFEQDADWFIGNAKMDFVQISNGVYQAIPDRINMALSSLNKIIPLGDISVGASAGDPQQSKTPAGVKYQQASLSIDDEDYKDNVYETYEAVAQSLINYEFANMEGRDIMKLKDEERDILMKSGLEFPMDEEGNPTNELEVIWDEVRSNFTFEIEAEDDTKSAEDEETQALLQALETRASDPNFDIAMMQSGYKFNLGEAYATLMKRITKNDKIVEQISPEEQDQMMQEQEAQAMAEQEQAMAQQPVEGEVMPEQPQAPQDDLVSQIMQEYQVDEPTALAMLDAEQQGYSPEDIIAKVERDRNVTA